MAVMTRLVVVFGILIITLSSVTASEICKKPCEGGLCDTMTCHHGQCSPHGSCICDDCWRGQSCDRYHDPSPPRFLKKFYHSALDAWSPPGYLVVNLDAVDRDEHACQSRDCACSQFYYKIEHGNRDGLFEIGETSGEIIATDRIAFHVGGQYTLLVSVAPAGDYVESAKDYATVVIEINGMNHQDDDDEHDDDAVEEYAAHHRVKRALPGIPDEVMFNMTKTGDFAGVSSFRVGDKVHFILEIFFPLGTTDMVVELFTPDNDTTIMVVCDPQVTYQGSNLVLLNGTVDPTMDSKDGSLDYDRAVLELGLVDNTGGESSLTSSNQLTVEWDVYMIDNPAIVNAGTYWISAGAEYDNDTTVWVGQMSFSAVDEVYVPAFPANFTLTGPATVEVGSSATFRSDIYIANVSTNLVVEAYVPTGSSDVMSVCSVIVTDTADNYVCLPKEKLTFDLTAASTGEGNSMGTIDLRTITNTGTRQASNLWTDNRVSVEWTLHVFDDVTLVSQFYDIPYAVWMDSVQVHTDVINVQVVNKPAPTVTGTPTFDFYAVDSGSVVVNHAVTFELEITVPSSSNYDFVIEVRHPLDASVTRMEVCDMRATYQGVNVPCVGFKKLVYNQTSTDHVAVWDLGRIRNTGQRSVAVDPLANKLIVLVTSRVTDHVSNLVSASLTTDVTVDYSNAQQWTGSANIIITDLTPPEPTIGTEPTFAASFVSGSDQFLIHSSVEIQLDITTQPGQKYSPFTIDTNLPVDSGSAVLTFCDVRVSHRGQNVPCMEPTITYSSSTNDNYMENTTVSLNYVSNTAPLGSVPTDDDVFTVSFVVLVQDHATLATNGTVVINMPTMFSPTQSWDGSISLTGLNLSPVMYQGTGPHFVLTRTDQDDSNTTVSQGYTATYQLLLKTPPDSLDSFVITASVTGDLSVCVLHMTTIGQSLPCMATPTPAAYILAPDGTTNTQGNMTFIASNIGSDALVVDSSFDANSLIIEVIVLMTASAGAGPHGLTVDVTYGYAGGSTWSDSKVVTMAAAPDNVITELATIPAVDFALSPYMDSDYVWENNVAKGQVIIFNLDITPTQASTNNILVSFHTPINDTGSIEICSVHVIHIGKNIPCLNKAGYKAAYDSRPGSDYTDIATIDLGTVCQFPIIANDTAADKISIEVTVKVTSDNSVNYGDTLWFNAAMRVNSSEIDIGQQSLLVHADVAINQTSHDPSLANLTLNVTSADLDWFPAGIYTVPIIITVPRDCSVRAVVNVTLPVVNTAVMTVRHIQVVSAGENLACLDKRPLTDFTPVYTSTQETTQNDIVTYDLDHIVNTGGTYRAGVYKAGDDDVTITVEIQLADSIANTVLSQHLIDVTAQIGDALLADNATVVVNRDGTESPKLELQLAFNDTITYTPSSVVSITGLLQHSNLSTAEAHNVSIIFYVPSVIADIQLSQNNFTAAVFTNLYNSQAFQFEFDQLLFTDIASLTFDVTVDPAAQPAGGGLTDITLSAEITSYMIYRDNSIYAEGYDFIETMSTTSAIFVLSTPAIPGCAGSSLGMQDGRIQDCQISASSNSILGNLASAARPTATGWISGIHPASSADYLQIYFGNVTMVTAIHMGRGDVTYASVSRYRVQYSDDGIQWHGTEDILTSYSGVPLVSSNGVLSQTEARYIRLIVLDTSSGPTARASMTVEFDGCIISSDITESCEAAANWRSSLPSAVPERGILSIAGKAYFCNMEQIEEDTKLCYRTTDDGATWTGLGGEVAAILGYSGVDSAIYGLARDYSSYILSRDDGDTWESIPQAKYTEASLGVQWTNTVSVGWDDTNPIAIASPTWTAKFDGIYISGVKRVDWDSCCTP